MSALVAYLVLVCVAVVVVVVVVVGIPRYRATEPVTEVRGSGARSCGT